MLKIEFNKQQKLKGENMKKTLLSVVAGLAVINAASAVPSPEDRKAMCDKYPDKYVWVEKNKACVPINPCISTNEDIRKSYCMTPMRDQHLSSDAKSAIELVLNRYAEKVLQSKVASTKLVAPFLNDDKVIYVAAQTTDGNYFVATASGSKPSDPFLMMYDAAFAYGLRLEGKEGQYWIENVNSLEECTDIVDFASLLAGEVVHTDFHYDSTARICDIWDRPIY